MERVSLNRREFHKLMLAACSGIVAGATLGCSNTGQDNSQETATTDSNPWTGDVHGCRGLNACQNKGASRKNNCRGQGTCATKEARHECAGKNACKYQGGCGATVAQNACKGQGECAVPLKSQAWKKARAAFETAWAKTERPIGPAPSPK